MISTAASQAWDRTAAELTGFITLNRRRPSSQAPGEKDLYDWALRQTTRMRQGMLTEHQEQSVNAVLDLFERVVPAYPTRTPSLDAAEQFHAVHGRTPSVSGSAEEAETAKALKEYIRSCRYRDGFRADTLERLLALPGAVPEAERAAFQRALHMLHTYRLPVGAPSRSIAFKGIRLNPASRPARVSADVHVRQNREHRYTQKWDAVFAEFTAWVREHRSLPRRRSTDPEEQRLANWLNVQRRNHRANGMPPALEAVLSSVPGALEPARFKTAAQWYAAIDGFLAEHGRLPSQKAGSGTEERSLAEYFAGRLRPALRSGAVSADTVPELSRITAAMAPARGRNAA